MNHTLKNVLVIGRRGSGKSSLAKGLGATFEELGQVVHIHEFTWRMYRKKKSEIIGKFKTDGIHIGVLADTSEGCQTLPRLCEELRVGQVFSVERDSYQ